MKQHLFRAIVLCFFASLSQISLAQISHLVENSNLKVGAERLEQYLPILEGKRIALIVNQTSVVGKKHTHLLDTLLSRGVDVQCVFAPEHGFRGDADAGEVVRDGKDVKTGIPIISLYGSNKKPSATQLANIDLILFDIQDVGARFYTYISTMYYAMLSASEHGKEMMILDRPNPCDYVDGPMLEPKFKSFVGVLPIPLLHGLTVAELAHMIEGEGWLTVTPKNDWLHVVKMEGWQHQQPYSLPIKPSPNLPNDQSIKLYPSLCLFEGTPVSVGRGTYTPFQVVGYPHAGLGKYQFKPISLPGFDKNPLQKGKVCYGIDLRNDQHIEGFDLSILLHFRDNWPSEAGPLISRSSFFDKLAGTDALRQQINAGWPEDKIRATWKADLNNYRSTRKKYLLYNE